LNIDKWSTTAPTYRNNQARFGVLQDDLPPKGGAWARISGQMIARVKFKNEMEIKTNTPDYLRLSVPTMEEQKENPIIPFYYDEDRITGENYGSAILLHPSKIETRYDEIKETFSYWIPKGDQIAVVELTGGTKEFYTAFLHFQGDIIP
jgi:hypothetical protein